MKQRPLTKSQALQCENATEPRCVCRCGGVAHGRGRIQDRERFSELHSEDPHYRPSLTKRQAIQKLRRVLRYAIIQSEWSVHPLIRAIPSRLGVKP